MTIPAESLREQLPAEVPGLRWFARTLVRDPSQAEDLVQDTLARALEKADSFRGDASPATWLHRIMHNLAVDQARRRREEPAENVVERVEARWRDEAHTVDPAEVVGRAETREELEDALVRLPVIYRSAVLLHDVHGLTVARIADLLDIGLPAAKQRLRRGRMMLVEALAEGAQRRASLKGVPMRCWDARQEVGDYVDGVLDARATELLEAHLRTCPTCPPLYASLVGVTAALGALRDPDSVVPPELADRIGADRCRPTSA